LVDHDFADPRLGVLFEHWALKCGGASAPRLQDLALLEIPQLSGILNLIEVGPRAAAFRHQSVGAALYAEAAEEIRGTLATIATECRPYRRLARLDWFGRSWLTMESLELPVLDETGRVAQILRASTFGVIQPPLPERLTFEPVG
jgi:hypothetical protein